MNRTLQNLRRTLVVIAIAAPAAYLAAHWSAFPETVPTHFGISGRPDAWGPRWNLLLAPVIGTFVVSLLTIVKRFPNRFNFPVKVTEANIERQRRLAIELLDDLRVVVAVLFGYISYQQMRTALNEVAGLGVSFMAAILIVLVGTIGTYFIRAVRA